MEKEGKLTNILLIILIVVILIFGGLFVYKEFINKDNKESSTTSINNTNDNIKPVNEDKEKISTNELSLQDEQVKYLIKYIDAYSSIDYGFYHKQLNEMSSEEKINNLVFNIIQNTDKSEYTEEEIKNEYLKIFGSLNDYTSPTKIGLCGEYVLDNGIYKIDNTKIGCGGMIWPYPLFKISHAKNIISDKNIIEIYQYVVGRDIKENENSEVIGMKYYSDLDNKNLITERLDNDSTSENQLLFVENKDKLGLRKFVFTKNKSGNYVFTSIENVK